MGGKPSAVRVTGPLAPHAAGYRRKLALVGYTPNAASDQLRLMAHASRWLDSRGLGIDELTPARVEEFLSDRRAEGYRLWLSPKAMVPVLEYLREIGVVPRPLVVTAATEEERLQEHYRAYLVHERGLAPGTIAGYLHVARLFLAPRAADDGLHLERLTAADVVEFVLAECAPRSVGSSKYVVCGLRALLRYLYVAGHTEIALDAAVPKVASWRLAGLPVTFGPAEVARLLASCDRRTTFGRRDHAVLTLLARLGLRAGEVSALELADIDWRAGELVVRGKGADEKSDCRFPPTSARRWPAGCVGGAGAVSRQRSSPRCGRRTGA